MSIYYYRETHLQSLMAPNSHQCQCPHLNLSNLRKLDQVCLQFWIVLLEIIYSLQLKKHKLYYQVGL
jgi:hypothetical protein